MCGRSGDQLIGNGLQVTLIVGVVVAAAVAAAAAAATVVVARCTFLAQSRITQKKRRKIRERLGWQSTNVFQVRRREICNFLGHCIDDLSVLGGS